MQLSVDSRGREAVSDPSCSLLILGLGNLLCGDDGAGVAAVAQLSDCYEIPKEVLVLDGGTLGLSLLPYLEGARRAILVDAVSAEAPPGTVVGLAGEAVARASLHRLSPHQIGVADLIRGARFRGLLPPELRLVGVVPESTELGLGLSDAVRAAIPELVERVAEEARALGHLLELRRRAHERSTGSFARLYGV